MTAYRIWRIWITSAHCYVMRAVMLRYRDLYYQAAERMPECDYETGYCFDCGKFLLGVDYDQHTRRKHAEDCAWCLILLADFYTETEVGCEQVLSLSDLRLLRQLWKRWGTNYDLS
jgi:hypothetical protein